EGARVMFNVREFRLDYEAVDEFVRTQQRPNPYAHVPSLDSATLRVHRKQYDKMRAFLRGFRGVYEQTAGISQDRVEIRSRFFRAINRRLNAADFWLEQPPSFCRERWFNTVH